MEYNGFKNYSTCLVALWLIDDDCRYRAAVKEYIMDNSPEEHDLADWLKQKVAKWILADDGFGSDVPESALAIIEWCELAEVLPKFLKIGSGK